MFGAIIGDIVGSTRERNRIKSKDFDLFPPGSRFTDDTVLTVAVADSMMNHKGFFETFNYYCSREIERGYGKRFREWLASSEKKPYGSFGNGSAMRVSPVAWYLDRRKEMQHAAMCSAAVTHDHPEGIKGAQAVAESIFVARNGGTKSEIKDLVSNTIGYDLDRTLDQIRPTYRFNSSCQGSVPEAIIAFLESTNYEDCIRNAISLGGDSDTQAAIAGSIAEAFYGEIPKDLKDRAMTYLNPLVYPIVEQFDREIVSPKIRKNHV